MEVAREFEDVDIPEEGDDGIDNDGADAGGDKDPHDRAHTSPWAPPGQRSTGRSKLRCKIRRSWMAAPNNKLYQPP
eukprot:6071940-Pyramimonas_sp.AAC.1